MGSVELYVSVFSSLETTSNSVTSESASPEGCCNIVRSDFTETVQHLQAEQDNSSTSGSIRDPVHPQADLNTFDKVNQGQGDTNDEVYGNSSGGHGDTQPLQATTSVEVELRVKKSGSPRIRKGGRGNKLARRQSPLCSRNLPLELGQDTTGSYSSGYSDNEQSATDVRLGDESTSPRNTKRKRPSVCDDSLAQKRLKRPRTEIQQVLIRGPKAGSNPRRHSSKSHLVPDRATRVSSGPGGIEGQLSSTCSCTAPTTDLELPSYHRNFRRSLNNISPTLTEVTFRP